MPKIRVKSFSLFDLVNGTIILAICFATLYPIWYTLVNSFNDGANSMRGNVYWWPRLFSMDNYKAVFQDVSILKAFGVSLARTVIGTLTHVIFTAMVSYGLSKSELVGRKFYMAVGTVTLFFSGGLIPTFLNIYHLGLYNSFLVYIIPHMFSFYYAIIFISFFKDLPFGIEESAKIDGANEFYIFIKLVLPLSMPVIATIALFQGVFNWNDYFVGVIYINKSDLQPIQTYLYKIISENSANQVAYNIPANIEASNVTPQSIKLATMVITTFPIVCVYPFLQRYFVKGMMLGSLKG